MKRINLNEEYALSADPLNILLLIQTKDKKGNFTGNYRTLVYYSNVEALIKKIQSEVLLSTISEVNTLESLLVMLESYLCKLSGGRITQPDVSLLEGCNVITVLPVGCYMLFSINPDNEIPPNRNVKCYSQGNGFYTEKDVVEVFNMIQNNCCAWCEL